MTIVAGWLNKERLNAHNLWLISDSRLSGEIAPLFDCSAKIFALRVNCFCTGENGFFDKLVYSRKIGIAFSGSFLLAANLFAFLNHTLDSLNSIDGTVPSLCDIAEHASKVLDKLLENYAIINSTLRPYEMAVLGYCPVRKEFEIYNIHQNTTQTPSHFTQVKKIDLSQIDHVHLMGDHTDEVMEMIRAYRLKIDCRDINWWRAPQMVINTIINNHSFETIGGQIQIGIGSVDGFELYSYCRPIIVGQSQATFVHQNVDLMADPDFMRVGSCILGFRAMV